MWAKSALLFAIFCNHFFLVAAWSIDKESCGPDTRVQNLRDTIEYVMQWPEPVDKNLGSDKSVNEYAKNLFQDQRSWKKVKAVVNAVGKMSKEDTSDTMDPIIYCDLSRVNRVKSKADPSITKFKDTKHDIYISAKDNEDCNSTTGSTLAFTQNWTKGQDKKKHVLIQLCPRLLKDVGQDLIVDEKGNVDVQRLRVASEFMDKMRQSPVHMDNFAPLLLTMFHEFFHTWKVREPEIDDEGDYGWAKLSKLKPSVARNTADSYAYLGMGTWIITKFGATISKEGQVSWTEKEESGPTKRNERRGQTWIA